MKGLDFYIGFLFFIRGIEERVIINGYWIDILGNKFSFKIKN